MKYKNTKSKIRKITNLSNTNEIQYEKQYSTDKRIKINVNRFNTVSNTKNKIYDYSSEFETLDTIVGDQQSTTYALHKEWRIVLPTMPVKLLPHVTIQIIYEYNSNYENVLNLDNIVNNHFFVVNNIDETEEEIKNPILVVGTAIPTITSGLTIKAKVLIKLYNPEFLK